MGHWLLPGLLCSRDQKILFKLFNFAASVCKLAASYSLVLANTRKLTASCLCDEWKRAFSLAYYDIITI